MLDKSDLGRLLEYTVWANHRALRAAALLSIADFRRDLGSSHGGVRGTLAHMMSAEAIWLDRWKGVSGTRLFDEGEFKDVVALRDHWTVVEEHRAAWVKSLRKDAAEETIRYKNLEGRSFEAPLWQLVQHLANHSSYHRGQVTALLRILGSRMVATDMVAWDRERKAKRVKERE
jgi:uncharacterized damage-inducible protein DinB